MSKAQDNTKTPEITALVLRPGLPEENQRPETPGTAPLPARYSEALATDIIRRIKAGNYPEVAAVAAGLPKREFAAWKRAVDDGTAHPRIVEFMDACERGEAFQEAETVAELSGFGRDEDGNLIPVSQDIKLKMLERRKASKWSPAERKAVDAEFEMFFAKLRAHVSAAVFQQVLDVAAMTEGK